MTLVEDLRSRLLQIPPAVSSHDDYELAPELATASFSGVPAAVLLPIVARDQPALLFTQRTEHLANHSGQISFPGGRCEDGDLTAVETAIRETCEETGIGADSVTVLGFLNRYRTGTGFDIQPVVGLLSEDFRMTPNPREVAGIFEVPLAFFLDPANRRRQTRMIAGRERRFYAFIYKEHVIWGATAGIIVDLATRLDGISLAYED